MNHTDCGSITANHIQVGPIDVERDIQILQAKVAALEHQIAQLNTACQLRQPLGASGRRHWTDIYQANSPTDERSPDE